MRGFEIITLSKAKDAIGQRKWQEHRFFTFADAHAFLRQHAYTREYCWISSIAAVRG